MIGAVPLPEWRDALALVAGEVVDDHRLAEPWCRRGEGAIWFSRGAFALLAVARLRRGLEGASAAVWLPDYFCNQSTAPLRQGGFELLFYPVGRDLRPDWDGCRALARTAPPGLFILVHYFGHPNDALGAREFCDAFGALLVEDAAHAALPVAGIGGEGDFVLYCPHKIFALPDGALLLARRPGEAEAMREAIIRAPAPSPWSWLVKRLARKVLPAGVGRRRPGFAFDPPFVPLAETPSLSLPGRRLLARAAPRLQNQAAIRRGHGLALQQASATHPGCRPLFLQDDAWTPYRFALRCHDPAEAVARFEALMKRGCWPETWPDLPPEVRADSHRHRAALELRDTLVLLPVHSSLNVADLIACCA